MTTPPPDRLLHVPLEPVHRPKLDTPTGLYVGACSCGWISQGVRTQQRARHDAQQHAVAKNRASAAS